MFMLFGVFLKEFELQRRTIPHFEAWNKLFWPLFVHLSDMSDIFWTTEQNKCPIFFCTRLYFLNLIVFSKFQWVLLFIAPFCFLIAVYFEIFDFLDISDYFDTFMKNFIFWKIKFFEEFHFWKFWPNLYGKNWCWDFQFSGQITRFLAPFLEI